MAIAETSIQLHAPQREREFRLTTSISSTVLASHTNNMVKQRCDTTQSKIQNLKSKLVKLFLKIPAFRPGGSNHNKPSNQPNQINLLNFTVPLFEWYCCLLTFTLQRVSLSLSLLDSRGRDLLETSLILKGQESW